MENRISNHAKQLVGNLTECAKEFGRVSCDGYMSKEDDEYKQAEYEVLIYITRLEEMAFGSMPLKIIAQQQNIEAKYKKVESLEKSLMVAEDKIYHGEVAYAILYDRYCELKTENNRLNEELNTEQAHANDLWDELIDLKNGYDPKIEMPEYYTEVIVQSKFGDVFIAKWLQSKTCWYVNGGFYYTKSDVIRWWHLPKYEVK